MTPSEMDITIGAALDEAATNVASLGAGAWTFALMNGRPFGARAAVDESWLVLHTTLDLTTSRPDPWEILQQNAGLDGGVRLALADGAQLRGRADLALDADLDLGARVRHACRGFEAAKGWLCGAAAAPAAHIDEGSVALERLAEVCRQTGWTVREREGEALGVPLDLPGGFYAAAITATATGVRAAVPLFEETAADTASACREAMATLLLRTSAVVRMVRAAAPAGASPCFEVPLPGRPSAAELSHALGALSVACRLAAREAHVLRHDETVARLYVDQQRQRQQQRMAKQKEN